MISLLSFLVSIPFQVVLSEIEFPDNYKLVPTKSTRKECLELRENQKVLNEETMLCLVRAMANSALKAFYHVENKCDAELNINPEGEKCYSVRAERDNIKASHIKEHKYKQSVFLALYYGLKLEDKEQDNDKVTGVELTLNNPLNCSAIYKASKRLSHGRGSGSSYSVSNITMDSTTHEFGLSVSLGYKTSLSGFIGGIEGELSNENKWSKKNDKEQGTTMEFKVPYNETCEPRLYQAALICRRQKGKLKIFRENGLNREVPLHDDPIDKGLLMPLDETQSDFFIPILGCVGH